MDKPKGSGQAGTVRSQDRNFDICTQPFAYFLPIFLQTDAKTYNQKLQVFVEGWMISLSETER